jgi:5,10-methylenetetrahydrofolate reductase
VIPERHQSKGDEHLRVYDKMAQGCRFFVSQGVYNVHAALDFLSDYHYHGQRQGIEPAPIIFTLTPCGSPKTLNFMQWLGISIPRWMENELLHAEDILAQSTDYAWQNWQTLKAYAERKGLPVGVNIESVAVRKVEVEASIALLARVLQG